MATKTPRLMVLAMTEPPIQPGKERAYHRLDCQAVRPSKRKVGDVWTEMSESEAILKGYKHHPGYDGCFPERE